MHIWTLIIIIYYADAPAVQTVEFSSKETCEAAKAAIQNQPTLRNVINLVNATCVKK